jgi:hypothetical protein
MAIFEHIIVHSHVLNRFIHQYPNVDRSHCQVIRDRIIHRMVESLELQAGGSRGFNGDVVGMIATIACRWVGWAQGRPGMAKNAGSAARIGVPGNGLWWKP